MAGGADGLHSRINRISHWDVNVTDLERSRRWYEAVTPLRAVAETSAEQAFPSLGIERGSFRGLMLRDSTQGGLFPMIHLVQWIDPAPVGTPYTSHTEVGWYRIVPAVSDIAGTRQRVIDLGSEPFAPTTDTMAVFHANMEPERYQVFTTTDPDGIAVEFAAAPAARRPVTPTTVAHNTSDVERFLPFYTDTLGLEFMQGLQVPGPVPNVYDCRGGTTQHDGALLGVRGDTRTIFDWLQWDNRVKSGPYREPNHVGIIRCALEVDDLRTSHDALAASPWAQRGEINVAEPETWDLGRFGTLEVVTFTDPEGVGFQLVQQRPWKNANLDAFGIRHTYGS
jgi:catechol 2,3-dioxygenase-like lactoylglutathione lyase family enzyme